MVVTAADVEQELQEEFARKNKLKKPTLDVPWVPHYCRLALGAGIFCSILFVLLPQLAWSPSREQLAPLPGQRLGSRRVSKAKDTVKASPGTVFQGEREGGHDEGEEDEKDDEGDLSDDHGEGKDDHDEDDEEEKDDEGEHGEDDKLTEVDGSKDGMFAANMAEGTDNAKVENSGTDKKGDEFADKDDEKHNKGDDVGLEEVDGNKAETQSTMTRPTADSGTNDAEDDTQLDKKNDGIQHGQEAQSDKQHGKNEEASNNQGTPPPQKDIPDGKRDQDRDGEEAGLQGNSPNGQVKSDELVQQDGKVKSWKVIGEELDAADNSGNHNDEGKNKDEPRTRDDEVQGKTTVSQTGEDDAQDDSGKNTDAVQGKTAVSQTGEDDAQDDAGKNTDEVQGKTTLSQSGKEDAEDESGKHNDEGMNKDEPNAPQDKIPDRSAVRQTVEENARDDSGENDNSQGKEEQEAHDDKKHDNPTKSSTQVDLGNSKWIIAVSCWKGKSVSCKAACADQGLVCDAKTLGKLSNAEMVKAAVKAAGTSCQAIKKEKPAGAWDGPHIDAFFSGQCTHSSRSSSWKPGCDLSPACGFARICPCMISGDSQGSAPKKLKLASEVPLMWWDVAAHVPKAIIGDWASETLFLDRVLRSFGKLQPRYKGPERLLGFQPGKVFDEKGMFAFDDSIRSIAIDVGAATNPLAFDLPIDNSQVAFFIEPVQWKSIEGDFEKNFKQNQKKGGCDKNFEAGVCSMERALVFPAAVSSELSHASFHATANPFCGSLEAFKTSDSLMRSKEEEVRGIYEQCYKRAGKIRKVPTVSLKSIIERTPKHIAVKYVKIDAQGHDFKVLLSAGDQINRIEYVRFEMQVDPPEEHKLVKDIPSYSDIKAKLQGLGFKHNGDHACYFDPGASRFSKLAKEMECVFCRKLPCTENARPPLGPNPNNKKILEKNAKMEYVRPGPWQIPAGMDTKESREQGGST